MTSAPHDTEREPPRAAPWNDPFWRGVFYQALLAGIALFLIVGAATNARDNMEARGIPMNFSFWDKPAGFDINQTLIPYSALSPYGRAFWVGLLNTLLVASIGVILTTILGFAIGAARLSKNWLIARLATVYVETIRNIPLLLQLLFWYNAVLKPLPNPRQSLSLFDVVYLNNRGLVFSSPVPQPGFGWVWVAFFGGVAGSVLFALYARRRQILTGAQLPVGWVSLALVLGLPLIAYYALGQPLKLDHPVLKGFNYAGGSRLTPEFVALILGLVIYTASFIAEIVRAGIQSVSKGQSEAAAALGLDVGMTRKLVVMPQAMRVIIPPLTSQYLNLTKNSTLAVFIGYPDLVQVFAGTVLNQTGAAVQIIAITMAVYLVISLTTSTAMNLYNNRMALKER